ncbi:stress response protein NST1 [Eurytemora carolleeae]|uniref:stress response protein NST1 n=1 Tax=Eurytemora carolleeae TaxID=1294199 RepID=UPI000C78ED30|nr:stress response protein NST1 [Eurytemora carolleeae]|eukprot:XP_023337079.1 stress response protein NST1-like [Eurytemora affinis]
MFKSLGCNIFVAHDPQLHKYWVLRISGKNAVVPPELEKDKELEAKEEEEKEKQLQKEPTTDEKLSALEKKLMKLPRASTEIGKLKKEIENLKVLKNQEKISELKENLSILPRYSEESARLKLLLEELEMKEKKRKEEEEARRKKEEELLASKKKVKLEKEKKESITKSVIQEKLEKVKAKKEMMEQAEIEKVQSVLGGRHQNCAGHGAQAHGKESVTSLISRKSSANPSKGVKELDEQWGRKISNMKLPKNIAKHRCEDKGIKKKSWAVQFKEFRAFGECVLDYLRSQGMNAHFILRVATDRDWAADVRTQQYWLDETNRVGKCNHYMYRGEAIFFAKFDEGNWKFGIKDLNLARGLGQGGKYPLEGKDFFHASNCDTHHIYHQAMMKGSKAVERHGTHSHGTAEISGIHN